MNAELTSPAAAGSKYVHGYTSTGMQRTVLDALREFRQVSLPVDLRIERALISAAVALCLADQSMRSALMDRLAEQMRLSRSSALERSAQKPVASVLIKRTVKQSALDMCGVAKGGHGQASSAAAEPLATLIVSNCVEMVMSDSRHHESWIEKTAEIVQWEIKAGYVLAKNGL
jgi:hypothetical protein